MYEGYLLYPYRKTAIKNQKRWHFGTLVPGDSMQTQCLVRGGTETELHIKIRFLQDEIEREVGLDRVRLDDLDRRDPVRFDPIDAGIEVSSQPVGDGVFRLTVRIANIAVAGDGSVNRAMSSTHTLLGVTGGEFISALDPPDDLKGATADCRNIGTWPVLAGAEGDHHLMLSSPIILYDYPQIAPESRGDFFDGTEMDEMLTLRVLTMTDEEKQEVRAGDARGREILERSETLPAEHMAKLHGAVRSLRGSTKLEFRPGDRVLLRPRKQADIFDIALNGKVAIVESIERDFEDKIHVAVTVEDDPGRDLGVAHQIGHRFFFGADEVELL